MIKVSFDVERDRFAQTRSWTITDVRGPGSVNTRTGPLWRADGRYPGEWRVRRHESGNAEMSFTAQRQGGKDLVKIIPVNQIDRLVLSLLEMRPLPLS
jgi:hypothetical protein